MHSYHIEKILFEEFSSFMTETEKDFIPPLFNRIEVNSYYEKLIKNAEFIVCRDNDRIIGLRDGIFEFLNIPQKLRGNIPMEILNIHHQKN